MSTQQLVPPATTTTAAAATTTAAAATTSPFGNERDISSYFSSPLSNLLDNHSTKTSGVDITGIGSPDSKEFSVAEEIRSSVYIPNTLSFTPIKPDELYTTIPKSFDIKSSFDDPKTIEEFKQNSNFVRAQTEWIDAENSRLNAVIELRRKFQLLEIEVKPLTGLYSEFIKTHLAASITGDSLVMEALTRREASDFKRISQGVRTRAGIIHDRYDLLSFNKLN